MVLDAIVKSRGDVESKVLSTKVQHVLCYLERAIIGGTPFPFGISPDFADRDVPWRSRVKQLNVDS